MKLGRFLATAAISAVALLWLSTEPVKSQSGGVLQATPGHYLHVVLTVSCASNRTQLQLGFTRLEWGQDGKTTSVRGLEPVMVELFKGNMKITSDLEAPKLKDGILTITVEGKGDVDFNILYGHGGTVPEAQVCKLMN